MQGIGIYGEKVRQAQNDTGGECDPRGITVYALGSRGAKILPHDKKGSRDATALELLGFRMFNLYLKD